jgi:hypothetical protein
MTLRSGVSANSAQFSLLSVSGVNTAVWLWGAVRGGDPGGAAGGAGVVVWVRRTKGEKDGLG